MLHCTSFAAGSAARATNSGAFVWSDLESTPFSSLTTNSFNVRANGGVRFVTGGAGLTVDGQPVITGNNGGGVTLGSLNFSVSPATMSIGPNSLLFADTIHGNFFTGPGAGTLTVSGSDNTANGNGALGSITSGNYNTAQGTEALYHDTSGNNNTANGETALYYNTTGTNNLASGWAALYSNVTGNNNVAAGALALSLNTSGSANVALGVSALGNSTGDSGAVAIGYQALQNDAVGGGVFTVGSANTAVGDQALQADSSGVANTGFGYQTLLANNAGNNNTAFGFVSLLNCTGSGNIGIGYSGGSSLMSGNNNIDIGNTGVGGDSGVIRIGADQTKTYIAGVIQAPSVTTITITGGADLAEPFPISTTEQKVSEGAVVVIDEANPGQLKLTDRPYDTRVAGVISGANGIHPGIQMHQQGLLEGGKNVALTGRVYVQADASNGAIKPGDLLTTSSTPGRAMKVSDHVRAQGAILGKAMTGLLEGKGMVLVLVTLQ